MKKIILVVCLILVGVLKSYSTSPEPPFYQQLEPRWCFHACVSMKTGHPLDQFYSACYTQFGVWPGDGSLWLQLDGNKGVSVQQAEAIAEMLFSEKLRYRPMVDFETLYTAKIWLVDNFTHALLLWHTEYLPPYSVLYHYHDPWDGPHYNCIDPSDDYIFAFDHATWGEEP